jgi:hypothetical protein
MAAGRGIADEKALRLSLVREAARLEKILRHNAVAFFGLNLG